MAEGNPPCGARRGASTIASLVALGMAGAWCFALLVAAVTVPVYSGLEHVGSTTVGPSGQEMSSTVVRSTSATLVEENGTWVLAVVAVPLVPVAIVATALRRRRWANRSGAGPVAWAAVGASYAFAFVTGFSIGIFVVPAVVFLTFACAIAEATPPVGAPSRAHCVPPAARTLDPPRWWIPYIVVATVWFFVTAIVPGPAVLTAFVVAVVGLAAGLVRYRSDPAASLPRIVFVGIAILAGSATLLLVAVGLAAT